MRSVAARNRDRDRAVLVGQQRDLRPLARAEIRLDTVRLSIVIVRCAGGRLERDVGSFDHPSVERLGPVNGASGASVLAVDQCFLRKSGQTKLT